MELMFGSHLSIAGGLHKALLEAEKLGCETVQIFTRNQRQWPTAGSPAARPRRSRVELGELAPAAINLWKSHCAGLRFSRTVSHSGYLINLASPEDAVRRRSIALCILEHRHCVALGIPFLVMHPGSHMGQGERAGIAKIVRAIDRIHAATRDPTILCLESTAGQGTSIGHRLEHLAEIIAGVKRPERVGVCLDTAHLFAAGYDFRSRKYQRFCRVVDRTVGLNRVLVWHLNDSKRELGSRVDRHEHIGIGRIGLDGFRPIVRDARWRRVPKILETAKGAAPDGREWDAVNLEVLRALM